LTSYQVHHKDKNIYLLS